MQSYRIKRGIATIAGLAVIAAETRINLSHVIDTSTPWLAQPLVLAVALSGVVQAIALMILTDAWRRGQTILATTTAAVLVASVAFTTTTTYKRISEARTMATDKAQAPKRAADARVAALVEIKNDECSKRGQNCRARETELTNARIAAASVVVPPVPEYGLLEMVPDLALPIMMLLAGFAFLAFAEQQSPMPNPDTIPDSEKDDLRRIFKPERTKPQTVNRTKNRTSKRDEITAYVLTETALGRPIPSQKSLCERFDCPRSTVADIVRDMEKGGLIARPRNGRHRSAVAA